MDWEHEHSVGWQQEGKWETRPFLDETCWKVNSYWYCQVVSYGFIGFGYHWPDTLAVLRWQRYMETKDMCMQTKNLLYVKCQSLIRNRVQWMQWFCSHPSFFPTAVSDERWDHPDEQQYEPDLRARWPGAGLTRHCESLWYDLLGTAPAGMDALQGILDAGQNHSPSQLSARLWYLQGISTGDAPVLH